MKKENKIKMRNDEKKEKEKKGEKIKDNHDLKTIEVERSLSSKGVKFTSKFYTLAHLD